MYQIDDSQAKVIIGALKSRASKRRQQIRNLERRKAEIIAEVGEDEFNHRIKLREKYISKLDSLVTFLS